MSDDNDDIQDPRYHMSRQIFLRVLYVGLHGPEWLYVLGMPRQADVRLSTPAARATDLGRGPTLRTGSGQAPCVPHNREHEERHAAGIEINAEG